jgi:hypothetical protein
LTTVENGQAAASSSVQESTSGSASTRRSRRPKVSVNEEREIARLYADGNMPTSTIRAQFGIGESSLYRIIQRQGATLRGRTATGQAQGGRASGTKGRRTGGATAGGKVPTPRGRRTSVARPRASVAAIAAGTPVSSGGTKFRVRYQAERVFEALSMRDALRQAESLGAIEIMAVGREDR